MTATTELEVSRLNAIEPYQRGPAVTAMLAVAHHRLVAACQGKDPAALVDVKAMGQTLQEIVRQLRLGRDLQLDAAEFVRRTERALGVAIRDGQARGEILRQGQRIQAVNQYGPCGEPRDSRITRPLDYVSESELFGWDHNGLYAFTDDVTDEAFEAVIIEARTEGNLSRANVARKARLRIVPPAEPVAPPPEPAAVRKTARGRRTIEHAALTINALALGLAELDPAEVDRDAQGVELAHLIHDIGQIRAFVTRVRDQ